MGPDEQRVVTRAATLVQDLWPQVRGCVPDLGSAGLELTLDSDGEGNAFLSGARVAGRTWTPREEACLDTVLSELEPGGGVSGPLTVPVPPP